MNPIFTYWHVRSLFIMIMIFLFIDMAAGQSSAISIEGDTKLKQRVKGDPFDKLPSHIEQVTDFGERPDISPDNKEIAFIARTFGDAMLIDIEKRTVSCITCHLPRANFIRVMHLPNGDFLLIGPEAFENVEQGKRESYLWYLSKQRNAVPIKLGPKLSEGVAVSKTSLKIAYTQKAISGKMIESRIIVAELDLVNKVAQLKNSKVVLESKSESCSLEAQDFFAADTKLSFFCYVVNGLFEAQVLDLKNLNIKNISQIPAGFNEPEGVFPDGMHTTIESDRQCEWLGGKRGSANLDIWKLRMDGSGKYAERLTYFNDFEGGKVSNPVISTNGRFMAMQAARSSDPPGMGRGIMLFWFKGN